MSVVTVLLLDKVPHTYGISNWACRLVTMLGGLHYTFVMCSVAPFPMLVFGLGLVVLLVKFLFHFMSEVQRNTSEIVNAVRSMLRIGSPRGHPQSICFQPAEFFFVCVRQR